MALVLPDRRMVVGGGLALAACGPRHPGAANLTDVTLRGATYRGNPDSFFREAGQGGAPYHLTEAQFASGTLIAQAINARAIDIGGMSEIPPVFVADAPGNLVRIIAVLRSDVNNQVVLVPAGSKLSTVADLRGRRVGYVRATTSQYILLKLLDEARLSWGDITPVALSPQDGLAAFQQGALDAWVVYGVIVQQARAAGARVLTTGLGRLSGNYVVAASSEALADSGRRAAIADYLQRYRRVLAWINADDRRYADLLAKATGVPAQLYMQQFAERSARSTLLPVSQAAIASQQNVADAFFRAGVIPAKVDVRPLWDASFVSSLV
ncbi:MAG: ABC transporter substrate-binding protein [Caulobacteraceae bacterium]|nr:ABC transporter substrate-binding protein [Caulobacteraceae bacterium]